MRHYNQKHHKFLQYQERNFIKDIIAVYAKAAEMVEEAENAEDMNGIVIYIDSELIKVKGKYYYETEEYFALNTVSSEDMHNSITKVLTQKIRGV